MMGIGFSEERWKGCTVTRKGSDTGRIDEKENERAGRLRLVCRSLQRGSKKFKLRE
jgi:hypothetical protein